MNKENNTRKKRIARMIIAICYNYTKLSSKDKEIDNILRKERVKNHDRLESLNKKLRKFAFTSMAYSHYDVPRLNIYPRIGDPSLYTYTIEYRDGGFTLLSKPDNYTLNDEIMGIIEYFFGIKNQADKKCGNTDVL